MQENTTSELSTMPHLGSFIYDTLQEKGKNQAFIVNKIGKGATSVSAMMNKQSLQVDVLWNIGKALNYDFFDYLSGCFNKKPGEEMLTKQQEIDVLQQQILDLKKEIIIYKDLLKR